jgi:hypothetical protein
VNALLPVLSSPSSNWTLKVSREGLRSTICRSSAEVFSNLCPWSWSHQLHMRRGARSQANKSPEFFWHELLSFTVLRIGMMKISLEWMRMIESIVMSSQLRRQWSSLVRIDK